MRERASAPAPQRTDRRRLPPPRPFGRRSLPRRSVDAVSRVSSVCPRLTQRSSMRMVRPRMSPSATTSSNLTTRPKTGHPHTHSSRMSPERRPGIGDNSRGRGTLPSSRPPEPRGRQHAERTDSEPGNVNDRITREPDRNPRSTCRHTQTSDSEVMSASRKEVLDLTKATCPLRLRG